MRLTLDTKLVFGRKARFSGRATLRTLRAACRTVRSAPLRQLHLEAQSSSEPAGRGRTAAGFFAHAAARDPPVSLENTVDLDDSIGHTTRVDGTASFGSVTPADEMQVNPQHCTDCNEFQRMPSSILQAARAHFSL